MTRNLFLGLIFIISISSCKKDYTCECKLDITNGTEPLKMIIKDSKKSAAKTMCEQKGIGSIAYVDKDGKEYPMENTVDCKLK